MKKGCLKVLAICIIMIITFQYNISFAASTSALKNEKESNNKELTNAQSDLKEVQGQKSKTMSEVEELDSKITSYETEIDELESKISSLNDDISSAENLIKQAESDYEKNDELLSERLILMYEDGNTSYIDFLLSSSGLTDFLSKYYMISELASYDTDLLEQISNKKKEIQTQKEKLESNKIELATSKTQKTKKQTELETAKAEKNKQVAQLSGEEKQIQEKIDQLKEDNKAIDAQIAAVQAQIQAELAKRKKEEEARKKTEQTNNSNKTTSSSSTQSNGSSSSSSGTSSSSNSKESSSGFIRPVTGYSVTTGWYYSSGALHGAVDFSGSGIYGKPVLAVADGIVVTTQSLTSSYGNYIIIAHYNGLYTLYAHGVAGSISVSSGQKVTQGQQIMKVGSTGNSTGPHLHFEVRKSPGKYANRVNPLNYLP